MTAVSEITSKQLLLLAMDIQKRRIARSFQAQQMKHSK
jgi:hypothetical protein